MEEHTISSSFGDRHVIGPDTEILGGVFTGGRVAVVADYEENPLPYEFAYTVLEARLNKSRQSSLNVVHSINEVVQHMIPFSGKRVRTVLREEAEARGLERLDGEHAVELSKFIGGGICYHQTLFGGTLLRLLQARRDIGGEVSVESPEPAKPVADRHTWLRYTIGKRKIISDFVFDSILELKRPLELGDRRYLRPEEIGEFVKDEDLTAGDIFRIVKNGLGDRYPFLRESAEVAS